MAKGRTPNRLVSSTFSHKEILITSPTIPLPYTSLVFLIASWTHAFGHYLNVLPAPSYDIENHREKKPCEIPSIHRPQRSKIFYFRRPPEIRPARSQARPAAPHAEYLSRHTRANCPPMPSATSLRPLPISISASHLFERHFFLSEIAIFSPCLRICTPTQILETLCATL
jgi:hypothetical protein